MPRIRLTDRVRLPDGSVTRVDNGLKTGTLVRRTVWHPQWNEMHGSYFRSPPKWKTDASYFKQIAAAATYVRVNGEGDPTRCRLVRRVLIETPNGTMDWGHVSQNVIAYDRLDAEIVAYTPAPAPAPTYANEEAA